MRFGFTTGSCAAAGAKAAAWMLLTGKVKEVITITTPKGIDYKAELTDIKRSEFSVSCSVIKDGGDDPDITSGCHVTAKVSFAAEGEDFCLPEGNSCASVRIRGGEGVGIVTKPGLDQKPGNPAINSVPRQMIEKEVLEVCRLCDYKGILDVEISVPEGREIALKTFNPRLGIEGGISILGTSGIVEPMSSQALLDTIFIELRQQYELGRRTVVITPGNYGLEFIKKEFNFDLDRAVKCSNFIGDTVDMAEKLGFESLVLVGHIGKLIKLSGGIMNTHSKFADCRMELLGAAAIQAGACMKTVSDVLSSISTEEGCRIIKAESENLLTETMQIVMQKILMHLKSRAPSMQVECATFCTSLGLLAQSQGFRKMLA